MMTSTLHFLKQLELLSYLERAREGRMFVVADSKVKNMLPQWLQFSPAVFWIQMPEEQKNLETFEAGCDFFLRNGIQRSSTLYAIGGGATTDLAGFMAASIMRGINWVAIPTTLIGMIDAAIGGKVGINTKQGKNLLGAFHEPQEVLICTDFLKSLSRQDILSGKGEIIKYAFLNTEIRDLILNKKDNLDQVINKCALYKQSVVEKDLHEKGERIFLNLGHTIGHALEKELKIPHGIAVAMGMKYLFKALEHKESARLFDSLKSKLEMDENKLDLGTYPKFNFSSFWNYLAVDKKRVSEEIKLVVVKDESGPHIHPMALGQLKKSLEQIGDFQRS